MSRGCTLPVSRRYTQEPLLTLTLIHRPEIPSSVPARGQGDLFAHVDRKEAALQQRENPTYV